jgi:hypothetical protein
MNRFEIEKLYEDKGLKNYKIQIPEDLLDIYGIDYKGIEGYEGLDDLNRIVYEAFIVNFFNGLGLESRSELMPMAIHWVEDISFLTKDSPEDDYFSVAGGVVTIIDRDGSKTVLRTWSDKDYINNEIIEGEPSFYLRIEYEHHGKREWLHVTKEGKEWY